MKKTLLLLFISLGLSGFSQQDSNLTIKGLVLDINNQPVANANITIIGTTKGTKTDKDGYFHITTPQKATTLKISHIAYYTKNKMIVGTIVNQLITSTIQLTPRVNQLETFEISAEKIELLYKIDFVHIYDYQFYEDKMLLLVNELKVVKLKLINSNNEILTELTLPKNTKKIYKDCFGNLHVYNRDTAYQLEIESKRLKLVYRVPINQFNALLRPCVGEFKKKYIFKQKNESKDIAYYYLDENKKVHLLKIIRDHLAKQQILRKERMKKEINRLQNSNVENNRVLFRKLRSLQQDYSFLEFRLEKTVESPLFLIKDTVYIFDHPNSNCYVFNENLEVDTTLKINYHHKKGWKKELIADEKQGVIYAQFEKGGLCYLKKIDLTTGKITDSYKLEKHIFPSNIKIRNNTAYYLYENIFNHGQMSLYKQSLY